MGDIHLRLFPDVAPKAVENFVVHAREGYYDNIIFHRVIKKFVGSMALCCITPLRWPHDLQMIQTGDPLGDGTGGVGYTRCSSAHPDTLSPGINLGQ